jgi:methionyl aminopeptidase
MSIETPDELRGMQAAGRVVAQTLAAMGAAVRPGVTTAELDAVAAIVFWRAGARSGPALDYGFPGVTCISVNDEAVHGIPGKRRLRDGDLVKLDVTAELDGYYADACRSLPFGKSSPATARLVAAAERALAEGLRAAIAGAPVSAIGAAVDRTVAAHGFTVCAELTGHGIGRRIHEPPTVPNRWLPGFDQPLEDGLVITVEPIISAGSGAVREAKDGWAFRTADGSLAAHAEHTVIIRAGHPVVLTGLGPALL